MEHSGRGNGSYPKSLEDELPAPPMIHENLYGPAPTRSAFDIISPGMSHDDDDYHDPPKGRSNAGKDPRSRKERACHFLKANYWWIGAVQLLLSLGLLVALIVITVTADKCDCALPNSRDTTLPAFITTKAGTTELTAEIITRATLGTSPAFEEASESSSVTALSHLTSDAETTENILHHL